jgi:hypothetical protein
MNTKISKNKKKLNKKTKLNKKKSLVYNSKDKRNKFK